LLTVATDPTTPGDRRVFFESRSRLTAADSDDHMDVYQWRNGELSLISTDIDDTNAFYSGNSETGDDVFIVTTAKVTWEDIDAVRDVYDVRVGGGFPAPPPFDGCNPLIPTDCAGPASAAPPATPITTTDPSEGNPDPGPRATLTVAGLSRKARIRAARRGIVALKVKTSRPGVVRAVARARVAGKNRRIARQGTRIRRPGTAKLTLRLSPIAKRTLRHHRTLRLRIRITHTDTRPKSLSVALRRPGRR
jgi:hypothetical protein